MADILEVPRDAAALAGAVALVTGGGGGIGAALARTFGRAGARVVVADLDPVQADSVTADLRRTGATALAIRADVSAEGDVERLLSTVAAEFGRLDVLVNNAAVVHVTAFDELPVDLWRRVFAVNVEGPLLMIQHATRMMRTQAPHPVFRRRGTVLNVSSGAAEHGRPLLAAYGASKAALNHLSRTAALVLADLDIAVTVVYPGNVREGMWRVLPTMLGKAEGRSPEDVAAERQFQPADVFADMAVAVAATPGMTLNGAVVDATGQHPVVR